MLYHVIVLSGLVKTVGGVTLFHNVPLNAAEKENIQTHSNKDIFWLQSRLLKQLYTV